MKRKVIFSSEPAPRFNGEQDYPEEDIYLARIAHHHRALLVSDDLGIMMADEAKHQSEITVLSSKEAIMYAKEKENE
jgi:hypothetical protein